MQVSKGWGTWSRTAGSYASIMPNEFTAGSRTAHKSLNSVVISTLTQHTVSHSMAVTKEAGMDQSSKVEHRLRYKTLGLNPIISPHQKK